MARSVLAPRTGVVDFVLLLHFTRAGYRNRTGDLFFTREVLYQLS